MSIVKRSTIKILIVLLAIGLLLVPVVSAGKFLNYGPIQGIAKTIPSVKNNPASYQAGIPEKTPSGIAVINESINLGLTIPPTPAFSNFNHQIIPKDYAIRIAVESIGNSIILTSDPVATLTTQCLGYITANNIRNQFWVVELSGTPTDPKAWTGRIRYIDSRTGEIALPPSHVSITVTIDAKTGKIIN